MVKFCHIAPTAYLESFTRTNGAHLILAHLVESDAFYREYYRNLDDGKEVIMDNSAFEMYKQGREMYPTDELLGLAEVVGADMIVMSDYPNEHSSKTIEAAESTSKQYRDAGYKTFFVPQSKIGDFEDYMECMKWALQHPGYVDRIGLSILGCPNAYGVEKDNKLQRYLSRKAILDELAERDLIDTFHHKDIFHCLGMVDGPNEIELLREYHPYIATWDSSAAVWAGLNEIRFDNSPTGMVNGKFEKEVDFAMSGDLTTSQLNSTLYNIEYIDRLANEV